MKRKYGAIHLFDVKIEEDMLCNTLKVLPRRYMMFKTMNSAKLTHDIYLY